MSSNEETQPLQWVPNTKPEVLAKMFKHKLDPAYVRPSRLDIEAQKAIIISKRCTCLFYEVGATIFHVHEGNIYFLADGYNGASKGDEDPRIAGCARVIDGELKQGQGFCRGSHAELNAIRNCHADTSLYEDVHMMVTLHPCYVCSKQIVNSGIKTVHYIWDYGREEFAANYLERLNIKVERYTSPFLENWIKVNNYDPGALKLGGCC